MSAAPAAETKPLVEKAPAPEAPKPAEGATPAAAAAAPSDKPKKVHEPLKSYWYPDRSGNVDEIRQGFADTRFALFPWGGLVLIVALVAALAVALRSESVLRVAMQIAKETAEPHGLVGLGAVALILVGGAYLVSLAYFVLHRPNVYLLDFAVYQPPEEYKMPTSKFLEVTRSLGCFSEEAVEFQRRMLERTGLGQETYLPPAMHAHPPAMTLDRAREEAKMVMAGACDALFKRTGIKPSEIDIVIANCSCFCPTPSLASMIVNHYKMRRDVKNFNLGGMGCSAGAISVDLGKDLLQNSRYRNKNVLIFSTENITLQWYLGEDKGALLINTLFRMGGAAILLTNKPSLASRAKYLLRSTVRVITAADDVAHDAIMEFQDEKKVHGVKLSKDLVKVVSAALKTNLTYLGPQVLPYSEQAKFVLDFIMRKLSKKYREAHKQQFVPNFKKAFQHYCIHAGGRAIIDGIEENLKLTAYDTMPSRATLYRYGNTSSSSVWYELNYIEGRGGVKKGDRVWQIAFGSGLKCNSVVWEALVPFKASPPQKLSW